MERWKNKTWEIPEQNFFVIPNKTAFFKNKRKLQYYSNKKRQ